jgi:cytochrome c oxidase cbb3-type subunit 3
MRKSSRIPPFGAFLLAVAGLAACGPADRGERVWLRRCAACHGKDGRGRTKFGANRPYTDLSDGLWKHGGDFDTIRRVIADGGDPKSPMPVFRGRLSEEDIDAVAHYVEKLPAASREKTETSPGK